MRTLLIALVATAVVGTGAAAVLDRDGAAPTFGRGTATVTTSSQKVVLRVEIARTASQQETGLMHRRRLAKDAGMVFVYDGPQYGGFWMKNTLIPLDIAFYDVRGRIVRTFRMEPCESDPCKIYSPNASYRGALEVNAGSFTRWKVKRGDVIAVRVTPKG